MPLRRSSGLPAEPAEGAGKFRQGARTQKPWAMIAHTGEVEQQIPTQADHEEPPQRRTALARRAHGRVGDGADC